MAVPAIINAITGMFLHNVSDNAADNADVIEAKTNAIIPNRAYHAGSAASTFEKQTSLFCVLDNSGVVKTFDGENHETRSFRVDAADPTKLRIGAGMASVAGGTSCAAVVREYTHGAPGDVLSLFDSGEGAGKEVQRMCIAQGGSTQSVMSWDMASSAGTRMLVTRGSSVTHLYDTRADNSNGSVMSWAGPLACLPGEDSDRFYAVIKRTPASLGRAAYCLDAFDVRYNQGGAMRSASSGNMPIRGMSRLCLPGVPLQLAGGGVQQGAVLYHYYCRKREAEVPAEMPADVPAESRFLHGVCYFDMSKKPEGGRGFHAELGFSIPQEEEEEAPPITRFIESTDKSRSVIVKMGICNLRKTGGSGASKAVIVFTQRYVYVYALCDVVAALDEADGIVIAPTAIHDLRRSGGLHAEDELLTAAFGPDRMQMAFSHTASAAAALDDDLYNCDL